MLLASSPTILSKPDHTHAVPYSASQCMMSYVEGPFYLLSVRQSVTKIHCLSPVSGETCFNEVHAGPYPTP